MIYLLTMTMQCSFISRPY